MTPSRFEFELLQSKVDFLMSSFEWTVGGIGIVVAVTLILVGYFVKRTNSREIEMLIEKAKHETHQSVTEITSELQDKIDETYRNLENMIHARFKTVMDEMYRHVDNKQSEMEASIYEFKNSAEGDIARSYALSLEDIKGYATAFNWWVTAAACYSEINSDILPIAIRGAKRCLEAIKAGDSHNIDKLLEKMAQNEAQINQLEKKHVAEAAIIRDLMIEKAKLPKDVDDTTPAPASK